MGTPVPVTTYLQSLTGHRPVLKPASPASPAALPLFLRNRYVLSEGNLFGQPSTLIQEPEGTPPASPKEYAAHLSTIEKCLGRPGVLILRTVNSYTRNRLVHDRIPFIVPGSQVFLPHLLVNLREHVRQPNHSPSNEAPLTAAAQMLVLFHLVRQPLEGIPLRDIATLLGYTAMTITKAKAELAGIVEARRAGKTLRLHFPADRRQFWLTMKPRLSSPVRKTVWGRWSRPPEPHCPRAGLSALSRLGAVTDDELPTIAMRSTEVTRMLEAKTLISCQGTEEAQFTLEAWKYDPLLLTRDGIVDPLSLYLSLQNSPDERIQQSLQTLLENFPW